MELASWPAWYVDNLVAAVDAEFLQQDRPLVAEDPADDPDPFDEPPPHLVAKD